jgi:hypothetical protein
MRRPGGLQGFDTGAQDHQNAREAEGDGDEAPPGHALAEQRNGEQRHPDRRGELQREDRRQGQEREAEGPAVGAREMHHVAREVKPEPPRLQPGPQLRSQERAGEKDCDPCRVANRQDLEDRECGRERAHRDGGGREGEERAAHPEDDGKEAAMGHGGSDQVNVSSDYPASLAA